ncbi:MAG: rod shape-determining protein RodA [Candidatus Krumholzibacteriota bacterium]|nr:rod shape-determining protein RodA [Candidatus Krumholzibacteriota bacterium]
MGERFFHNFEWLIFIPLLALILIGLLNLYSVGHVPQSLQETFQPAGGNFFHRQIVWVLAGVVVMGIALAIPLRYYEVSAVFFYFVPLIFLVVVLLLEPAKGSSRWIVLGGFRFQPSEMMKIGVIFLLARLLSGKRNDPNRFRIITLSFLIVLVPFLLIIKQPDLGTALVFPALLFPVLFWRGLNESILILFLSPVISAFLTIYTASTFQRGAYPYPLLIFFLVILVVAYRRRQRLFQSISLVVINLGVMLLVPNLISRMKLYQQRRILAFLKPESDILGMGWQVYQSKVAIGSGGFGGKGFLQGTQKLLAFLPERHSDFVYSVLSEESGFIGSLVVILLYTLIVTRGLYLATKVKNRFASMTIIGICSYFAFHVIINVGMTIGLAPVTGLPLPLLSYGGSSMLVTCFLAGVLMNFGSNFYEY